MRVQLGAARLSILTKAPVQPITFSTGRAKVLRGWDRFMVPFPFGRGVQIYGETLYPPSENDDQAVLDYAVQIENALNKITERADQACGRMSVEPDPAPERA